ncbi:hypothetical protein ACSSNL_08480 [Thalassobius sp. S69A]|uniref:hypothetical protein n=1 Tax=unclassified Thalassovita TaxID=2619711 RepID=UPI000C0D93C4|nr:hypothetical protein [Paracoccaceae bacterium]MBT26374.1 hypothetical protein [Paracoccaceae bacterium]
MNIPACKRSLAIVLLCGTAACTTPDLSGQIVQVSKMLDDTVKTTGPALQKAAEAERQALLRQAARSHKTAVTLPKGCRQIIEGELAKSVAHCHIQYHIAPQDRADSPILVSRALVAMQTYFAVLGQIATTDSPDQIKANSASLLGALASAANAGDFAPLTGLHALVEGRGGALSATAGFFADQARIRALRRTIKDADPHLSKLVTNSHELFTQLGDTVKIRRDAVSDSMDAYTLALSQQDTAAQIMAVNKLQKAVQAMHTQEKVSPIRRLHLAYDMHRAMLTRLEGGPSLTELNTLTTQVAAIVTLLEE